MNLRSFIQ